MYSIVIVFSMYQYELAIGSTCVPSIVNPLLPPSLPYPSRLSQSTSFGCPASCIKLALVVCFTYDSVYV